MNQALQGLWWRIYHSFCYQNLPWHQAFIHWEKRIWRQNIQMSSSQFRNCLLEIRLTVNHLEPDLNNPPILNNDSPSKRPKLSLAEEQRKKKDLWSWKCGLICRFLGQMINITPVKILHRLWVVSLCYPMWAVRLFVLFSSSSFRTSRLAACYCLQKKCR